jgi:hypothetical protein
VLSMLPVHAFEIDSGTETVENVRPACLIVPVHLKACDTHGIHCTALLMW